MWAVIAATLAAGAATRSTWSPCGLSMLSTITPLGERARGRRFGATAAWFVAGAVVGGAALGGMGALGASLVAATGISPTVRLIIAAVAVALGAAVDLGWSGPALPHRRRQVNEQWLDEFRGWVAGGGFGLQIGCGLATYVMTTGVYLVAVLGALSAVPLFAVVLGMWFGWCRGMWVVAGRSITSPAALATFHQRMEQLRVPVQRSMGLLLVGFAVLLAVLALIDGHRGAVALAGTLAVVGGIVGSCLPNLRPSRPPQRSSVPG